MILGVRYRSLNAAYDATGILPATIKRHLEAGTLDEYARAARRRGGPGSTIGGKAPQACVVDGTEYPSIAAAAAAHGMKAEKLRRRLKTGAARYRDLPIGYAGGGDAH